MSKSQLAVERRYNTEREALGILHGLVKSHYYCFASKVGIITDHEPLVVTFKNRSTGSLLIWPNITIAEIWSQLHFLSNIHPSANDNHHILHSGVIQEFQQML